MGLCGNLTLSNVEIIINKKQITQKSLNLPNVNTYRKCVEQKKRLPLLLPDSKTVQVPRGQNQASRQGAQAGTSLLQKPLSSRMDVRYHSVLSNDKTFLEHWSKNMPVRILRRGIFLF